MPDIFFGGEQALEASLRFLIVAIHIDQNLRGTAIVGHVDGSYANQVRCAGSASSPSTKVSISSRKASPNRPR